MCPASTSTTMPSGCRQPVTMTFWSEPSAFSEKTRPPLKSRTNRRPMVALLPDVTGFGLETSDSVMYIFSLGLLNYAFDISIVCSQYRCVCRSACKRYREAYHSEVQ